MILSMGIRGIVQLAEGRTGVATTVYRRIAEAIAAGIDDGTWPPGSALPAIPDLMDRYGVSRNSVRGAIDELTRRGLVYTGWVEGKRGTYVRTPGVIDHYATDALRDLRTRPTMDAFRENAERVGKVASFRFDMRIERAPRDVADRLGVDPNTLVVVRQLWQLLDGEPWGRETGYYPRDLAEEVGLDRPEDMPEGTIRTLDKAGHHEIAHRDELTFDTASPQDAHDLGVAVGASLAVQTRTAATADRVTRVMRYVRIADRSRLIFEIGESAGIDVINATDRTKERNNEKDD